MADPVAKEPVAKEPVAKAETKKSAPKKKFDEAGAIIEEAVSIVKEVIGGVGSNTRMNFLKNKLVSKFPERAKDLEKAVSDVFKGNVTEKK
jgi:hypothetical protein